MRSVWLLIFAVAVMAQAPPEPGRQLLEQDPQAFCMAHEPINEHAHQCSCAFMCETYIDGEVRQREDPICTFYCVLNPKHCACHADESCPLPEEPPNASRPNAEVPLQ